MNKLKYKSDLVNTKFSQFDTIYKSNRTDINVLLNKVKIEKKKQKKKKFLFIIYSCIHYMFNRNYIIYLK